MSSTAPEATPVNGGEVAYDSRVDTYAHIHDVQGFLAKAIVELTERSLHHDETKLIDPEKEAFDRLTPKLRSLTYGSPEYEASRKELGEALAHHYAACRHHPEHQGYLKCEMCFRTFPLAHEGLCPACPCAYPPTRVESNICGMNLIDLLEMICDWLSAVKRHNDGSISRSLEVNQKRFGYSDELKQILLNTVNALQKD